MAFMTLMALGCLFLFSLISCFNQFCSVLTQRSGISTVYQHKDNDDGRWLEKFEISSTEKLLTYLASFQYQ